MLKFIDRALWKLGYWLSELNNRSGLRLCLHRVPEGKGLYRGRCYEHTPGVSDAN